MNYGFFISTYHPSKNYVGKDDIIKCVESIRRYHPDAPIIIVDSDSKDLEYINHVKKFNVTVDLAKNKHRSTGMIWHAYDNYDEFDFYYFLHDGHKVNDKITDALDYDISTIRYFNSHNGLARTRRGREYGFSPNGSYPYESRDWCKNMLETHTPYRLPDLFTGVSYSVFFCKRSVLEKMERSGMKNILPLNKNQDQSMERVWGVALEQAGYDLKENSYINTEKIHKTHRVRK